MCIRDSLHGELADLVGGDLLFQRVAQRHLDVPATGMDKLNETNFPQQKHMTKKDYVIICGDFGDIWSAKSLSLIHI